MGLREKKAQSVLEYVIVLTAIIAIIIVAATAVIRPAVNKVMEEAANTIGSASERLP